MGFFVHPIPLLAVAVMAFNDHWLKYQYPSFLTGKLSDFCGVFYFPIFILAIFQVYQGLRKKPTIESHLLSAKNVLMAIAFTDFLMVLVKLNAPSARWIEQIFAEYLFRIQIIQDPTDLWSLLMNPLTFFYLKSRQRSSPPADAPTPNWK